MEDKPVHFLTKLFRRNQTRFVPKSKTRSETDEEFFNRVKRTPFFCTNCGGNIYPEWIPVKYSNRNGEPVKYKNVQGCNQCRMKPETYLYHTSWDDCWNRSDLPNIHRAQVPLEE